MPARMLKAVGACEPIWNRCFVECSLMQLCPGDAIVPCMQCLTLSDTACSSSGAMVDPLFAHLMP